MNIIFSEGSGLADSVYGNCQAPIRMFLESRGEDFEHKSVLKDLFLMGTSDNFGDILTSMTAMDGFEPVGENGAYPDAGMQQGYSKFIEHETWKNRFRVSAEMVEDNRLLDLKKGTAKFFTSYHRTREMFGAALYAGAIQGKSAVTFKGRTFDVTGADGVPVFSQNHVGKVSGKKQCNIYTDEFSVDALDRMESAMHLFRGDNDEILDVSPDTIVIAEDPDLKRKVFAAIGADKDPNSANNGFNYQFGRWRVIIWSYLNQFPGENAHPWILMDSQYNQTYGGAVWNDRIQLEMRSYIDENTSANVWNGRSRFIAAFNDFRFAALGGAKGGKSLAG